MEQEALNQDIVIENDWSEQDRRRYERYAATFYLRVYLAEEKSRLLGEVTDISLGGMRLMCNEAVPPGRHYRLRMVISLDSGRCESILLEACSVWTARDEIAGGHNAGFEFRNLSPEASRSIENIIAELSA